MPTGSVATPCPCLATVNNFYFALALNKLARYLQIYYLYLLFVHALATFVIV